MFDRRYSVNELVRTADGEKITEFISDLMLKNKNLPNPNYGLRTQKLESFVAKLNELDEYRKQRKESILEIIRCLYTRLYFLNRHNGGIRKWLRVTLLRNVASKSFYIIQFC